jgi:hypothetical protein
MRVRLLIDQKFLGGILPALADLVKNDCRIASRMITESLNILKAVVLRILKEDLGKESCVHVLFRTA